VEALGNCPVCRPLNPVLTVQIIRYIKTYTQTINTNARHPPDSVYQTQFSQTIYKIMTKLIMQ